MREPIAWIYDAAGADLISQQTLLLMLGLIFIGTAVGYVIGHFLTRDNEKSKVPIRILAAIGFAVVGAVLAQPIMNWVAPIDTQEQSLQAWAEKHYDVTISEQQAEALLQSSPERTVKVDFYGTTLEVNLAYIGDYNGYLLAQKNFVPIQQVN